MDALKRDALKMDYWAMFQYDILNGNFSNIQRLYDASHITNEMLVRQIDRHTASITDFTDAIFSDITYLLSEELVDNPELVSVFDDLYYKQYKAIYDGIRAASEVILKDKDRGMTLFSNVIRKACGFSGNSAPSPSQMKSVMATGKYRMLTLLHMRDENLQIAGTLDRSSIAESAKHWREREDGKSELYLNDENIVFTAEEEPVFQSRVYIKFVERQKEALAAYLGIQPEKLAAYFEKQTSFDIRREDFTFLTAPGEAGISSMATLHVIQNNYGGAQWLQSITASKSIRKNSKGYRPDFDKIADLYYRARVMVKYIETTNADEDFTALTLSRGCKSENPKDDYLALLYIYNIDIVYQMFKYMREMYYRNFSWEQISRQGSLTRANEMIQELRNIISSKDITISDLTKRLDAANAATGKITDSQLVSELREKNRLLDEITQRDREIAELKKQLRCQNELIDAFNSSEDEPENVFVDMEKLQTRRYLFVGHTEEDFPELNHALRSVFPNSIFIRSETDNIDGIQVDAVVIFLNWTSHGMYYKIKANNALSVLPVVYCKSKNIDKIYQEMQAALTE